MTDFQEIINICNNLFYGDYFDKGGSLKTKEELDNKIKSKVTDSLIDFFGQVYSDLIRKRVGEVTIEYNYKTLGNKNSISDYLREKRREYVRNKTGVDAHLSGAKLTLSLIDSSKGNYKKLVKEESSYLDSCLESFGYDKTIFDGKNKEKLSEFVGRLRSFCEVVDSGKYSDISEVNENMHKVREYVVNYQKEAKEKGFISDEELLLENDEIASYTTRNSDKDLLSEESTSLADYEDTVRKIRLGVSPDDGTIIHEFLHAATHLGFEKNNQAYSTLMYSGGVYRKNQIFDEVIIEYLAQSIFEKRQREGLGPIVNLKKRESSYEILFPYVKEFIWEYLPELSGALLGSDPFNILQYGGIIENYNLNPIVGCCNEIYALALKKGRAKDLSAKERYEGAQEHIKMLENAIKGARKNLNNFREKMLKYAGASGEELEKMRGAYFKLTIELMDKLKASPQAMKKIEQCVMMNRLESERYDMQQKNNNAIRSLHSHTMTENQQM